MLIKFGENKHLLRKTLEISGRLWVVMYTIIYFSSVLSYGFWAAEMIDNAALILLAAGLGSLTLVFIVEIIRKISLFILFNQRLLNKSLQNATKVFGKLSLFIIILAPVTYLVYVLPKNYFDTIEKEKAQKTLKAEMLGQYTAAQTDLPTAKLEADSCYKKEEAGILAGKNAPQSSTCRNATLGYNSCIDTGISRTSCLYMYDYESACKPVVSKLWLPVTLDLAKQKCNTKVNHLESVISSYEAM